ncbi:outer membrane beta-barrel protein [Sulfurimonas sp.]|uniref:outer membrane beta-barrel protein n=1 Tax=Sulfurimonas sp. TaxID=2022749 RepID=UPI0025EB4B4F|nr:outer membrane beta-barrel protein [Sulfurimonas sp.]
MKKIIIGALLGCSLLSTQVFAESKNVYIGLDVTKSSNEFSTDKGGYSGSVTKDSDSSAFKLKVGRLLEDNWRAQVYYLQETYDDAMFDSTNESLSEVGFDVIKEYELSDVLFPFAQVGIGYGWMDIDGYSSSSINEVNGKFGVGLIFKVAPAFEIITGADAQYKKWSDREIGSATIKTTESSTKFYIGANYHF